MDEPWLGKGYAAELDLAALGEVEIGDATTFVSMENEEDDDMAERSDCGVVFARVVAS